LQRISESRSCTFIFVVGGGRRVFDGMMRHSVVRTLRGATRAVHGIPGTIAPNPKKNKKPEKSARQVEEEISLAERAAMLEVRMTKWEIELLAKQSGAHQELRVTRQKFLKYSQKQLENQMEKEAFLAAIEEPAAEKSALGRWMLPVIGFIGTASYAVAGTQVAGDAGMNIVGEFCGMHCLLFSDVTRKERRGQGGEGER